jgi:MFS family permease
VTISKPSGQALFRHRDFVLLWGGQTVSQSGTQVTILALPLVAIVALKATTFQVGLLSVADTSAYLLVALPAGVLADSMRRRPLMLSSCIALMVVVGSVPVAQVAGILSLAQLYVVALVSSVLSVLFSVAYTSYLPALVKRDQLIDANGKLRTSQSFAELAGPSLGALLVGVFGSVQAIVGDALSYAFSSACLLLIQSREPRVTLAGDRKRAGFRAQLGEAITYVLHDPVLRKTVAWSGTANFFVIMVETLGPVYLIRSVHLRPAYVGLLLAVGAAGGVTAGSMSGFLARRIGSARITWLSMTVFTVPGLLIPLARPGWWALLFAIGWMSWTFGSTLCGVAVTTYQQATCPPELRGRVSGTARWVTWGTLPLGGLAAGSLGSALGAHATLWMAAIGGCLSGLWLYFSPLRHMRDMPLEKFQPASSPT